ncbi:MAG: hypothetical protein AAF267_17860 [Deinococcota bacterium]
MDSEKIKVKTFTGFDPRPEYVQNVDGQFNRWMEQNNVTLINKFVSPLVPVVYDKGDDDRPKGDNTMWFTYTITVFYKENE